MSEAMLQHYVQNGGTVIAIAGVQYALVASDTRSSAQGAVVSNDQLKIFRLSNHTAVGLSGNMADTLEIVSRLEDLLRRYSDANGGKEMSLAQSAELLSVLLYERRIFPYLVQVLLVGIDSSGRGGVYSYDPVGHCEKVAYRLHGTSAKFMLASMSYLLSPHEVELDHTELIDMDPAKLTHLVQDFFTSCSELDPATGQRCEIWILRRQRGEVTFQIVHHALRRD